MNDEPLTMKSSLPPLFEDIISLILAQVDLSARASRFPLTSHADFLNYALISRIWRDPALARLYLDVRFFSIDRTSDKFRRFATSKGSKKYRTRSLSFGDVRCWDGWEGVLDCCSKDLQALVLEERFYADGLEVPEGLLSHPNLRGSSFQFWTFCSRRTLAIYHQTSLEDITELFLGQRMEDFSGTPRTQRRNSSTTGPTKQPFSMLKLRTLTTHYFYSQTPYLHSIISSSTPLTCLIIKGTARGETSYDFHPFHPIASHLTQLHLPSYDLHPSKHVSTNPVMATLPPFLSLCSSLTHLSLTSSDSIYATWWPPYFLAIIASIGKPIEYLQVEFATFYLHAGHTLGLFAAMEDAVDEPGWTDLQELTFSITGWQKMETMVEWVSLRDKLRGKGVKVITGG